MCSPLRRKTLRLLQKHFRQLSPPLSAHGSNDTVAIWCGATTVEEESAHRLAIDHGFADNASHIFWGFVMFRAIVTAWISLVVGAAVVADTSAAEAQNKSELLRSLHFQKGRSASAIAWPRSPSATSSSISIARTQRRF
jgi:hypothetical protein